MMARHPVITGWGHYLPEKVLTNDDLDARLATSDAWIRSRTGIRERHLAAAGETTSALCVRAAEQALARAQVSANALELVICATTTPDQLLPATACVVQQQLGAVHAGAFDLNTACTGFLYALTTAAQYIEAGMCRRVLVVAGETLSRFVDWQDRGTCVLFGDGAGAVVLEAVEQSQPSLTCLLGCRGDADRLLTIAAGGSARPATATTVAAGEHCVRMHGGDLFKLAVRWMSQAAREVLGKANVPLSAVRRVIPHQANLRIIQATQEALGLPAEKVFVNVDRCGNTGAASVAIALADYLDGDSVPPGEHLLLVSFGGGLTWAAVVVRWPERAASAAAASPVASVADVRSSAGSARLRPRAERADPADCIPAGVRAGKELG
jgi:3-oxoacyl-[acyl-carrier-protein] synthase-3